MLKYGLPKYISFDVRTSLCCKKPKFNVRLSPKENGNPTTTKASTIKDGMLAAMKDRVAKGIWTSDEALEYYKTYDSSLESKFSLDLACKTVGVAKDYVLSGQYMLDRYGDYNAKRKAKASGVVITQPKQATTSKKAKGKWLAYLKQNPRWALIANFPEYEIYSEPYLFTNEYGITCWTYKIRHTMTQKEIKPSTKGNSLYVNLDGVNKAVYKLAADTFIHNVHREKDRKLVATEIHHKNGDDTDNHLENLIHVTKAEHMAYHKQLRMNKPNKKFTDTEIAMVMGAKKMGGTIYTIASKFGYTVAQVRSILLTNKT